VASLVIGLGNPGGEYRGTRHNVGWSVLQTLEARGRFGRERREVARGGVRLGLRAVPCAGDDRRHGRVVEAPPQRQLRQRVAGRHERLQLLDQFQSLLEAEAGERRWVGWINPGHSYLCSSDPQIWTSVKNTLWLIVFMVPAQVLFALGVALLLWAGGNIYFTVALFDAKQVPIPSWADAGYLSIYPGAYVALVLMLRSRVAEFRASIWLDGLIGALAVGAVGAAVLLKVVLATIGGDALSVGFALAYPLLDLLLVAFVVAVAGLSGWNLDRPLCFVAAGFLVFGLSDGFYVYQNTVGSYHPGSVFDMGWPVAIVLLALAAWQPSARVHRVALDSWRMLALPSMFALLALANIFIARGRIASA